MSDIAFSCPKCEGHLLIEETGVGMQVDCPHCGETITGRITHH